MMLISLIRGRIVLALIIALLLTGTVLPATLVAQESLPTQTPTEPTSGIPSPTPTNTDIPTSTPQPTLTETPTESPSPTFTETPTEPLTPAPTETETLEASLTPSETVTETASPTAIDPVTSTPPIETETATPSLTPSLTATATAFPPEPPLSLLFSDNFDSGALYLWTLGAGWTLVPSENGQALQVTNSDEPVTFVHSNIDNAAVQARFLMNAGMARLSLRQSEAGSYTAVMDLNGQVSLYRSGQLMGAASVTPVTPGQWRTLRLSAIDTVVRVAVDDVEVIAVQDVSPLPTGTFSLAGIWVGGDNGMWVDDVSLWVSDTQLVQQPTATSLYEAVALPTPTMVLNDLNHSQRAFSGIEAESVVYEIRGINTYTGFVQAINTANNDPNNTYVIYMLPGVYTIVQAGVEGLEIRGNVVIVGNLADEVNDPTVPDSNKVIFQPSDGTSIFFVYRTLTLYNVILQGGGAAPSQNAGGAIRNQGFLYLYNSLLRNNRAIAWGGAIYSGGPVTTINTVFDNNSSTGNYTNTGGGAVALQYAGASFRAECTTFSNNYARSYGGAIFLFEGTGGLSLWHNSDPLQSNNFESNQAIRGYGAIYNLDTVSVDVTNQWWNPAPSTIPTALNSVYRANYLPTASSAVALNCAVPPIPAPTGGMCLPHSMTMRTQMTLTSVECSSRDQMQSDLMEYGVTITDIDETAESVGGSQGYWTNDEICELLKGVSNVGQAADVLSATCSSASEAFRNTLLFSSSDIIEFIQSNDTGTTCGETVRRPEDISLGKARATITCGGNLVFTEYTATHELGHVFLHQSAYDVPVASATPPSCTNPNAPKFIDCINVPMPVTDDNKTGAVGYDIGFVFGTRGRIYTWQDVEKILTRIGATDVDYDTFGPYDKNDANNPDGTNKMLHAVQDWERGLRGWGSPKNGDGPCAGTNAVLPTSFQQNACNVYQWIAAQSATYRNKLGTGKTADQLATTELEEAGADMFLNWVYRAITQTDPSDTNYEGFQNASWDSGCTAVTNCPDNKTNSGYANSSGPGDDRWFWMNDVLTQFFSYYGW